MATRHAPSWRATLTVSVFIAAGLTWAFLLRDTRAEVEMKAVSARPAGAEVLAFPVEVKPGYQAIALIDKENETLSLYQYDITRAAHERLVLLAARSFRYDRLLEDYNTAQPRPDEIKKRVMLSVMNPPKVDAPVSAAPEAGEPK